MVIKLHHRLLIMNNLRSFQLKDCDNVVRFCGVTPNRLLFDAELNALHARGTGEREAFVHSGTTYNPAQ